MSTQTSTQTEPSKNDLRPVAPKGTEKEPMFLIDTSGSMSWAQAADSKVTRVSVVGEAIGRLVGLLEGEDSQAEAEAAAGEDAGGVMTILFSDADAAVCIDDLSSANVGDKWDNEVVANLGGGTHIMPGWELLVSTFLEEFGDKPADERPAIMATIITDGEAVDAAEFAKEMAKVKGSVYVVMAVVGYGDEHDRTLRSYAAVDTANENFRLVAFGGETDPKVIADALHAIMS